MEWLLNLLFSKAGAVLAGALGVLALWIRMAWLRRRAEKSEARTRTAEAQVEIQKVEAEYAPDIRQTKEAGRTGDAGRLADLINRLWGDKTKPE